MIEAEELIDQYLEQKYSVTPGMKNAMGKHSVLKCKECGLSVPKYPGRYPSKCSDCGGEMLPSEKTD